MVISVSALPLPTKSHMHKLACMQVKTPYRKKFNLAISISKTDYIKNYHTLKNSDEILKKKMFIKGRLWKHSLD